MGDGMAGPEGSRATPDAAAYSPFGEALTSQAVGRREVIANPSMAEIMQTGPLPEMALGRKDAPVTIVQYASMTCPYCRQFQIETLPLLKREYIDTGKVRYVLRAEFPIGKQSGLATIALRCAPPDKYFALYDKLMRQQATWVSQEVRPDPIFKVASQVGMTRTQFDSCRENRGMIEALNGIKERGRTLGIIG
ncbi:MAG: thioredoxin domain-containing protein, partial [Hyphomicrobiaceae bacterium]|nr:thioredoxin domain-containing protein [Hyphomicrobiaceae bacterium]